MTVFGAHVVDDPAAPAGFALYETQPSLATARPAYRVYGDCTNLCTTTSLPRAMAVLAGLIDEISPLPTDGQRLLHLEAVALVGGRTALLGPWSVPYRNPSVEAALRRDGVRLLERTSVLVDPESQELVVPPIRLLLGAHLAEGDSLVPDVRAAATPARRYSIVAWFFEGRDQVRSISRADAVARGMRLAHKDEPPSVTLERLANLVQEIPTLMLVTPKQIVAAARNVLEVR